jgi:hypothetical protein
MPVAVMLATWEDEIRIEFQGQRGKYFGRKHLREQTEQMDCKHESRGRVPALQARTSEFQLKSHKMYIFIVKQ